MSRRKPVWREWLDAAVFAIVAATLIRAFLFEAFTIPTGSMEGTMLINDYLFVNKLAYGPRVPMTPLAVPLVHNTIAGRESYSTSVKWGYHRFPGMGKVERNDVVVFNYPCGDTILAEHPEQDYYQNCRMAGRDAIVNHFRLIIRPVDKRDNYIKRCIGVPGDVLEIKDARVYINGQPNMLYPHSRLNYVVTTTGVTPNADKNYEYVTMFNNGLYIYNLANDQVDLMKKMPGVLSVKLYLSTPRGVPADPGDQVFPFDTVNYKWNKDNYGPMTIPKQGVTVTINTANIAQYRRIIHDYERNTLEERDGKIFINGSEASSYTFKMDYYWMMGDNRHNSLDSRFGASSQRITW